MYGTVAKQVPGNDFYLFKSCQVGSWYPGIERSLHFVLERIGANFVDDPRQSSCTGCGYHTGVIPLLTNLTLNARNFSLVSQSGKENIVCTCPTCYANLKGCKGLLDEDSTIRNEALQAIGEIGIDYDGSFSINHISEVFRERLDSLVSRSIYSMRGIRAITHHGCHYSKIFVREVASGNFEKPRVLDDIAEGFGSKTMDYPERFLCCGVGFHHTLTGTDYPSSVLKRKYSGIIEVNPDVIITQCAGCTLNLDLFQENIMESLGVEMDIPVLYVTELVALLMGADPYDVVGLDMHAVPVEPLLERMGILGGGR
jgi:heterodisulfide reductase subunit B